MDFRLIQVFFARIAGSLLALLFVMLAPFVLDSDEIGRFFQSFSLLIFISIITRFGSEIYFFERKRRNKIIGLYVILFLGGVVSVVFSVVYILLHHMLYMAILPLFTMNWTCSAFLKTINKPILAQVIEYYVLYFVLLIYLLFVSLGWVENNELLKAFVLSVVLNFILVLFFLYKNIKYKAIDFKKIKPEVKIALSLSTFQNILLMYGNYFVMWGPILIYSYIATSMDDVGLFSLAYKYAASLMLLVYVFHSVYSEALSDKNNGRLLVLSLDKVFRVVMLFFILILWCFVLLYGYAKIADLFYYTIVLLSSISLYIVQVFKLLYLTYSNEKYILVYIKVAMFLIMGVLSLVYVELGVSKIEYFLGLVFMSFLGFFIIIEFVFKKIFEVK